MQYRKLGHSNLVLSEIGLGCMSLPQSDRELGTRLIQESFDAGINYFDTADLYDKGDNERLLGKAVKSFRESTILATKVGNQWNEHGDEWSWNPSKPYILKAVEQSLQRLDTDYIDLYQLHGGTSQDSFEEVIETFEQLIQEGKIRYYGISSIRPNVFKKYLSGSDIASNMMQFSILDSRPEEYFGLFQQNEVSILARGSLAQGLLLDKKINKGYLQHLQQELILTRKEMEHWAQSLEVDNQTIALYYVLQKKVVASTVVGVRTHEHLSQLLTSYQQMKNFHDFDLSSFLDSIPKIKYQDHL